MSVATLATDFSHTQIKSSTSREEVHYFARKVEFYEREENVKVARMLIISPMLGPRARELAEELGIKIFTSAYDVRRSDMQPPHLIRSPGA